MLFVTLCNLRSGVSPFEGARRRADWTPPEGMKIVAEYWLTTNTPACIVVVDTNNPTTFFESRMQWADVFDMESFAAITGEEGGQLTSALSSTRAELAGVGV